jgi:TorA maturation chaperone TorD
MELFRALGALVEPPSEQLQGVARELGLGELPTESEYTELFVFQLVPYASIYLGPEGMMGGVARDRIAGFWRAIGQTPPAEPDHLSVLLATYAQVCDAEASTSNEVAKAGMGNARRAFLYEHLLSWLPVYLLKLDGLAPAFYRAWADLVRHALEAEKLAVGEQEILSQHLRSAPELANPDQGGLDEFINSLLSPVRSGFILTRSDISRAANKLELGIRLGERRFALRTLMDQDPNRLIAWLANEARDAAGQYAQHLGWLGAVNDFWIAKASSSSRMLDAMRPS